MAAEASKPLSVGAALQLAKRQLEGIAVRIVGEVSELSNKPGYAAVYFTLKDGKENASLPCLMWMNRFKQAGVAFKVGDVLDVTGRFSLYAAKGRMNFEVASLALAGEGDIRLRIANLAKKLEAEGLMRAEAKRALPRLPERIGLVTSPRGAAVYDVLRTLRRRYPCAEVLVAGVPVEGKDAPLHLMAGLDEVCAAGAEVVLLVRGGGSFEDLMPFNDEALARHIAAMTVPVVTGIGHEPDTSIADMVADVRASTPTAAAEAVAPDIRDIQQALHGTGRRMGFAESALISQCANQLMQVRTTPLFTDPLSLMRDEAQMLDDLARRLESAIPDSLKESQQGLSRARMALVAKGQTLIAGPAMDVLRARTTLRSVGPSLIRPKRERASVMAAALEGLSPLGVLARGYAAAFTEEGRVISSIHAVSAGERMDVHVSDGTIACVVSHVTEDEPQGGEERAEWQIR